MLIGVTQRVDNNNTYNERRDALDQKLIEFLQLCNCTLLSIPNNHDNLVSLLQNISFDGFCLSGGNSLACMGGSAPERDIVDNTIIKHAIKNSLHVLGICRGMQSIVNYFGIELFDISGHVDVSHFFDFNGISHTVRSFHELGTDKVHKDFSILAKSSDDIVESIIHKNKKIAGIMWHPEREKVFSSIDIMFVKNFFANA